MREVEQYRKIVNSIARKVHNKFLVELDLEDMKQELFLKLVELPEGMKKKEVIEALEKRAREVRQNARSEHHRQHSIKKKLQYEYGGSSRNKQDVLRVQQYEQDQKNQKLWLQIIEDWEGFVEQRDENDRKIISLIRLKCKQTDIAFKLGMTQPAVSQRIRRILDDFKQYQRSLENL